MPAPPVIVVAPASFKGALPARDAAAAVAQGLAQALGEATEAADVTIRSCPLADGGEGTLDALLACGGTRRLLRVRNAAGDWRDAAVGILPDGSAVVETAQIVGFTDAAGMRTPAAARSTLGIGDALRQLLDLGVRRFHVALGGSSTNDGGAGLLTALGLRLLDAVGRPLAPVPAALGALAEVDVSGLDRRLRDACFVALADVDNPFAGAHGATAVFGPQKGIAAADVERLDAVLDRYAAQLEVALQRRARTAPGAGAAGGLGFALLLGAERRAGAEVVADQVGLDAALADADWLITGEGRSDAQTLRGKAPAVAGARARRAGVPATLLSGALDPAALPELRRHFDGCFACVPGPIALEQALGDAATLLRDAAEQLGRFWAAVRN